MLLVKDSAPCTLDQRMLHANFPELCVLLDLTFRLVKLLQNVAMHTQRGVAVVGPREFHH
jgi:hypothetical protein